MKKVFLLLAIAISGAFAVQAQGQGGGGMQRRTPEERLKQVKEKLVDLKLDNDQTTKSDSTFMEYFRAQGKIFEEMRAGGAPDREQVREKMQKLSGERDDKLKKIYSEEQFKKWKDEIEPSMRQRGGGGGQRSGGNN
jgi:periplasmic protein CpxP/Spy